MSRGLSQNQRKMLGIAYSVNKQTQAGVAGVKTGPQHPRYKPGCLSLEGPPDLYWQIVAHELYGACFVSSRWRGWSGNFIDTRQPGYASAKASSIRALSSLFRGGYLAWTPGNEFSHGYFLTDKGFEIGAQNEVVVEPAAIFQSGLVVRGWYSQWGPTFEEHGLAGLIAAVSAYRAKRDGNGAATAPP